MRLPLDTRTVIQYHVPMTTTTATLTAKPTMTAQDWSDVLRYSRRDLDEAIQAGADYTEQRFLRAAVAHAEAKRAEFVR